MNDRIPSLLRSLTMFAFLFLFLILLLHFLSVHFIFPLFPFYSFSCFRPSFLTWYTPCLTLFFFLFSFSLTHTPLFLISFLVFSLPFSLPFLLLPVFSFPFPSPSLIFPCFFFAFFPALPSLAFPSASYQRWAFFQDAFTFTVNTVNSSNSVFNRTFTTHKIEVRKLGWRKMMGGLTFIFLWYYLAIIKPIHFIWS